MSVTMKTNLPNIIAQVSDSEKCIRSIMSTHFIPLLKSSIDLLNSFENYRLTSESEINTLIRKTQDSLHDIDKVTKSLEGGKAALNLTYGDANRQVALDMIHHTSRFMKMRAEHILLLLDKLTASSKHEIDEILISISETLQGKKTYSLQNLQEYNQTVAQRARECLRETLPKGRVLMPQNVSSLRSNSLPGVLPRAASQRLTLQESVKGLVEYYGFFDLCIECPKKMSLFLQKCHEIGQMPQKEALKELLARY